MCLEEAKDMKNITILIPKQYKEMYLLCATPKHGYIGNALLFWGKNDSGYYSDINKCQLYTKEEVMEKKNKLNIPVKLSGLTKYLTAQADHASSLIL